MKTHHQTRLIHTYLPKLAWLIVVLAAVTFAVSVGDITLTRSDLRMVVRMRPSHAVARLAFDLRSQRVIGVGADGIVATIEVTPAGTHADMGVDAGVVHEFTGQKFVALSEDASSLVTRTPDDKLWLTSDPWKSSVRLPTTGKTVAISKSGDLLAVVGPSNSTHQMFVTLTDTRRQVRVWGAELGETTVTRVEFSPDGAVLSLGDGDGNVALFSVETGTRLATLRHHGSYIAALRFSPSSRLLAVGTKENGIRVWDVANGKEVMRVGSRGATLDSFFAAVISSVVFTHDERTLIAADFAGMIQCWDVRSWRSLSRFKAHPDGVSALLVMPDDHSLISGGIEGLVKVWNLPHTKKRTDSPVVASKAMATRSP